MTVFDLLEWFEGYYGDKYRPAVREEVAKMLDGMDDILLRALKAEVRDGHSNQYKQPPDVAILRKYLNPASERARQAGGRANPAREIGVDEEPATEEDMAAFNAELERLAKVHRVPASRCWWREE